MQEFCRKLCYDSGGDNRSWEEITYKNSLEDPDSFFKGIGAASSSKVAYDRLVRGPRQRTDRVSRKFRDGTEGDIYVAVMRAIAHTGPKTQLTIEEIRTALRQILSDKIPQGSEITRVLSYMDNIAKKEIRGESVIDWDRESSTLHIADPFFAFYLKWS
jgi:hypothetical protein